MLPIFNNQIWLIIMGFMLFLILKDLKQFKGFNIYAKVLHISGVFAGIFMLDILSGEVVLEKIMPNYFNIMLPLNIAIYIIFSFLSNFHDIKASDISANEKYIKYKQQKKYMVYLVIGCIWLYFSNFIGKSVIAPILIFIGLGK